MIEEPNILNIPAFQRKKSIAAKAKTQKRQRKQIVRKKRPKAKSTTTKTNNRLTDIPIKSYLPIQENFEENSIPSTTGQAREMKTCGRCEGYFDNISVAIIEVTSPIRTEDYLIFETVEGLFEEQIHSMQINKRDITLARSGCSIGVKVSGKPKVGGLIYKVI